MPLIKSASAKALKANIEAEYKALWDAEQQKPAGSRRSKKEVSKQAYAIAKGVQDRAKQGRRKAAREAVEGIPLFIAIALTEGVVEADDEEDDMTFEEWWDSNPFPPWNLND